MLPLYDSHGTYAGKAEADSHGNYTGHSEQDSSDGVRLYDARSNYPGRTDKDGRLYGPGGNNLRRVRLLQNSSPAATRTVERVGKCL